MAEGAAIEIESGKRTATQSIKSDFSHPCISHPGFTVDFPKVSEQSKCEKGQEKIWGNV